MINLIDYKEYNGAENMRIDYELLETCIKNNEKTPILRFYGWSPKCVSLGRNQNIKTINEQYCIENKIDIVRRITGGRGLLHDDELTYSFICPFGFLENGNYIKSSYKEISSAIIIGFKKLGITMEFGSENIINTKYNYCMSLSTGADLNYKNKKIIGSAQFRSQDYILQHGSILLSYNENLIKNIFNEEINKTQITCINEINSAITRKDIAEALKFGFKEYFKTAFRH